MGDIAYGGGSQLVNNATRHAFQKYLHGQVAVDRVYPVIGNHVGALRGREGCGWRGFQQAVYEENTGTSQNTQGRAMNSARVST